MDGWMDGWMDKSKNFHNPWMDGWMDFHKYIHCTYFIIDGQMDIRWHGWLPSLNIYNLSMFYILIHTFLDSLSWSLSEYIWFAWDIFPNKTVIMQTVSRDRIF